MNKDIENYEDIIKLIWLKQRISSDSLKTLRGQKVEIISQGTLNNDQGPDFKNASIKINGNIINGDIEIHTYQSDWYNHGHHCDEHYDKVILHIVMWNDGSSLQVERNDGKLIPVLVLSSNLNENIVKLFLEIKDEENASSYQSGCSLSFRPHQEILRILDIAGEKRFVEKAENFKTELKEGKDIEELLYQGIMEGLGYKNNKIPFVKLAQKLPINKIKNITDKFLNSDLKFIISNLEKDEKEILILQSVLFGTAGLLPSQRGEKFKDKIANKKDDNEDYINKLEKIYNLYKQQINSGLSPTPIIQEDISSGEWLFFRVRPQNFPTVRIASASFIIQNWNKEKLLCLSFNENLSYKKNLSELLKQIESVIAPKAKGYWTTHYDFYGKEHKQTFNLVGKSRTADIIINTILPIAYANALQINNDNLKKVILDMYSAFKPLEENYITTGMQEIIFKNKKSKLIDSAKKQQGLIYLFKLMCQDKRCGECISL